MSAKSVHPIAVAWLFVAVTNLAPTSASIWCGEESCYDILKVTEKATESEIKKSYRKLSLLVHPDKNKSPDAPAKFQRIANAYEILIDSETRRDYDYALAHPEEKMYNQYRYYHGMYRKTVKADVRLVISGALVIFSLLQVCSPPTYSDVSRMVVARYLHGASHPVPNADTDTKPPPIRATSLFALCEIPLRRPVAGSF